MSALCSLVFVFVASAAFADETCLADDGKECDSNVLLQSTINVDLQEPPAETLRAADIHNLASALNGDQNLPTSADDCSTITTLNFLACQQKGLSDAHGNTIYGKALDEQRAAAVDKEADSSEGAPGEYGDENCPCVGIDDIAGKTTVHIGKNKTKDHKADVGASCKAWEDGWHPSCKGDKPPAWCKQKWCYVDPCNCKKIADVPKPSDYLPKARYIGKPLHYSYATCGGADSWTSDKKRKALKHVKDTCAVKVNSSKWGQEDCRCVGIGPQPGTTKVKVGKSKIDFPASTGAFCHKWEENQHPACKGKGSKAPKWCSQAWCYVDPCKCKSATPPKTSSYLPDANYQGKPVYYSYATCGGNDHFSAGDKKACVNKKTKEECATLDKCAWNGKDCLGKDLVKTCNKAETNQKVTKDAVKNEAFAPNLFAAIALSVIAFLH